MLFFYKCLSLQQKKHPLQIKKIITNKRLDQIPRKWKETSITYPLYLPLTQKNNLPPSKTFSTKTLQKQTQRINKNPVIY